ncbi:hypothetical protein WJX72_008119 [[Myrmecia] bisecta]|uniref:Uncharacterized protein n=1 Tax=[Myrmecia] bisecta TaxID=41462 RepID=A0AAW1QSM1_9CHLO
METLQDTLRQQWLSAGTFGALVYQAEYVTAFLQARKASDRNPPAAAELADLESLVQASLQRLRVAHSCLIRPDWQGTAWAQYALALQPACQHLLNVVCRACLVTGRPATAEPGAALLHQLLVQPFKCERCAQPGSIEQARDVFDSVQPGSLLLRALRKWWRAAPQSAVPGAGAILQGACHDPHAVACNLAGVVNTGGLESDHVADAWYTAIFYEIESYAPMLRLCLSKQAPAGFQATGDCLLSLRVTLEAQSAEADGSANVARWPALVLVLRDVILEAAAWAPSDKVLSGVVAGEAAQMEDLSSIFLNAPATLRNLVGKGGGGSGPG